MTTNGEPILPLIILIIGIIIVVAILSKFALNRLGIPILIGYLFLGLILRISENQAHLLTDVGQEIIGFWGKIGLICLLFRVGLESDLGKLISQLRRASLVWLGNVTASGLLGFLAAFYLLHLGILASLFIATAMTATSVGISVSIWQEAKRLDSPNGDLMLDVAEMDDISAIFLMALLFNIAPVIHNGYQDNLIRLLRTTIGIFCSRQLYLRRFASYFLVT